MCGTRFISNIFFSTIAALFIVGCGNASEEPMNTPTGSTSTTFVAQSSEAATLEIQDPLYIAYNEDASFLTTGQLDSVSRELALNQFQGLVQPTLSSDLSQAETLITGLGISAVDNNNVALKMDLGIEAREIDPNTGQFGPNTRIFSAPGVTFASGMQSFLIQNTDTYNYILSGMGATMANGKITGFEIQTKTMNTISSDGDPMTSSNYVTVDDGWAATGFYIRIYQNPAPSKKVPKAPQAFISDVIFFPALLQN